MAKASRNPEIADLVRRLLRGTHGHGLPTVTTTCGVVIGGVALLTLAPGAASAVGLGEASPRSALGEPLRASVAMRLASGETLREGCVSAPGAGGRELSQPSGVHVRGPKVSGPALVELELSTRTPLYEPLYELTLQVDCPGLPKVLRHYVLMLDLPGTVAATTRQPATPAPTVATSGTVLQTAAPARPVRQAGRLAASSDPIPAGSRYRVREGDTLSTIAARVAGRPANGTWRLAELIYAANPSAFIGADRDLIKLGAEISIPGAAAWTQATDAPESTPVTPATPAEAAPLVPPQPARILPETAAPTAEPVAEAPITAPVLPAAPLAPSAAEPLVAEPLVAETPAPDMAPPGTPAQPGPVAPVVVQTPAVAPAPASPAPPASSQINPLLAVLLGMVLGLGLSFVLLRSQLLDRLAGLLARRRPEGAGAAPDNTFANTDEWLKTEESLHAEPVEIGAPAEQTYIVEVETGETAKSAFEAISETDGESGEAAANEDAQPAVPAFDASAETELAELFDDELAELPAEPDLPVEIFAESESAESLDGDDLPGATELQDFDSSDALYDPTLNEPVGDAEEFISAAEMADDTDEELDGLLSDGETVAATNMQGLEDSDDDPARLSATLQEALTLLEAEAGDGDLTASQIVDPSEVRQALADQADLDDPETEPAQKRAG